MNKTVLLVDDEMRMRKLIADFLLREGYTIIEAENGQTALDKLSREKIDLVILDVMIPIYDGWMVLREIRKTSTIPVIMLTAKSEEVDQLFGFEIGADEYITKPFSPRVLTARVNALFRRLECGHPTAPCNGLKIDPDARIVSIDNCRLEISPNEYDLLVYLVENRGRALSREQIQVTGIIVDRLLAYLKCIAALQHIKVTSGNTLFDLLFGCLNVKFRNFKI